MPGASASVRGRPKASDPSPTESATVTCARATVDHGRVAAAHRWPAAPQLQVGLNEARQSHRRWRPSRGLRTSSPGAATSGPAKHAPATMPAALGCSRRVVTGGTVGDHGAAERLAGRQQKKNEADCALVDVPRLTRLRGGCKQQEFPATLGPLLPAVAAHSGGGRAWAAAAARETEPSETPATVNDAICRAGAEPAPVQRMAAQQVSTCPRVTHSNPSGSRKLPNSAQEVGASLRASWRCCDGRRPTTSPRMAQGEPNPPTPPSRTWTPCVAVVHAGTLYIRMGPQRASSRPKRGKP